MVRFALILAAAFLLFSSGSSFAMEVQRFVQEEFVIGFWVDPPAEFITDERYKEIADAHFNLVIGVFGPRTPADIDKLLDLCEKHGMMAIVKGDARDPDTLRDHPACMGYLLVDEPNASQIPDITERIELIRQHRPGKLAYYNLFPDYASPGTLGTATYDEYVARFALETDTDALCMDHYPMLTPTADGRDRYCENLEVMRKYALQRSIPHWNFFNIMPFGPHHDPTESHVRWQIYTSLAYGSKGILYFCYWTPQGWEFPKGGAIITVDGRRTRHYDQAKRINSELKNLGPALMKLTSTDVIRVTAGEGSVQALEGTPIRSITGEGDFLVAVFTQEDGRQAILLNNYDHNYTAWPTVEFSIEHSGITEIDKTSGEEIPLRDDSPAMEGLQISLDAGEGRLFLF